MKLYIKQKVFSWADKFSIKDSDGVDRYYVEGELFTWGHKLHMFSPDGHEVAFVKQKLMTWMPKFEVYLNDVLSVEVVKEFAFLTPKYILRGVDWTVNGDFLSHNYTITNEDQEIASISKAWLSWGDSYELIISDSVNEVLAVATVLAIDCVLEAQNSNH
jgi:uncharacterized protein YxjI